VSARSFASRVAFAGFASLIGLFFALPMLWLVFAPFNSDATLAAKPSRPTLENFHEVFVERTDVPKSWGISVLLVIGTVIVVFVGAPAAYALSRIRFPGRDTFPGVVGSNGVDVGGVTLPLDGSSADAGHDVIYGIRPEYITIDGSGPIRGEVSITENVGTDFLVTVDLGDGVLIKATIQEGSEPQPGDTVSLAPSARRALLYDRETGTLVT
jgi:TOBE domain